MSAGHLSGTAVRMTIGKETFDGVVDLASTNLRSLAVDAASGRRLCLLAVYEKADGFYKDIFTDEMVKVEFVK
jgi:hypothetical protein